MTSYGYSGTFTSTSPTCSTLRGQHRRVHCPLLPSFPSSWHLRHKESLMCTAYNICNASTGFEVPSGGACCDGPHKEQPGTPQYLSSATQTKIYSTSNNSVNGVEQMLGREERSLQSLLSSYAGIWQDKSHQLDDWRMR